MTLNEQFNILYKAMGWVFHEGTPPVYGGTYKRRGWTDGKRWCHFPPPIHHNFMARARGHLLLTNAQKVKYVEVLMGRPLLEIYAIDAYAVANAPLDKQVPALLIAAGLT